VVLGSVAVAIAGAQPAQAQPGAQRPSGPVIECEVIEQASYQSARYRISNPGDAPVDYRFVAVIENNGNTWSSDPVAGTLEPGAEAMREFRPFPQGVAIQGCAAAVGPARVVAPPEPQPVIPPPQPGSIRFADTASDLLHVQRAFGGLVLGGLGGLGLGLAGAHLGSFLECWGECYGYEDGVVLGLMGGTVGYVLGTTFGVGLAWDHAGASSPYGAAFGGILLGGLTGIGIAILMGEAVDPEFTVAVLLASPPIGATVAIALTHRHSSDGLSIGSLLHLRDGELVMGVPVPLRATVDGAAVTTLPLLGGQF
jgi:hypothetical protein